MVMGTARVVVCGAAFYAMFDVQWRGLLIEAAPARSWATREPYLTLRSTDSFALDPRPQMPATPAAGAAGSGAAVQSEDARLLRCEIEDRAGALQPIVAARVGDEMNLPVHLPADADVPEIEDSAFRV